MMFLDQGAFRALTLGFPLAYKRADLYNFGVFDVQPLILPSAIGQAKNTVVGKFMSNE